MSTIQITIDGVKAGVPAGTTILDAAKSIGIRIPTLCYLPDQRIKANCRICLVEVEGMRAMQPACATPAAESMVVRTDTAEVIDARRNSLQLILSHHPIDCQSCARLGSSHIEDLTEELCGYCFYCDCVRDGDCELQQLAEEYAVNDLAYEWEQRTEAQDKTAASFSFNPNKCILCRRCVDSCGEGQGVYVWSVTGRGDETRIRTALDKPLGESACVECGQCVRNCPVGALCETQEFDDILDAAQNKHKAVIVRAEPYFLQEYLRLSGQESGGFTIDNLAAGLHRIGADLVVENGAAEREFRRKALRELEQRMDNGNNGPLLSASCPAVVRYIEKNFPELTRNLSGTPSPQQIFGRTYQELNGREAYAVSLTPCSARKMEAARQDHQGELAQVMSPREIKRLFTRCGADLELLPARKPDIRDGGNYDERITETDSEIVTAELKTGGRAIKAAAVYGLRAVQAMLEKVEDNACEYDYLQLLACPKGCISVRGLLV